MPNYYPSGPSPLSDRLLRSYKRRQCNGPSASVNEADVLAWFRKRGAHGGTDAELIEALGHRSENTIRPRRIRLHQRGLLIDSGHARLSPRGRLARVWVAKRPWWQRLYEIGWQRDGLRAK